MLNMRRHPLRQKAMLAMVAGALLACASNGLAESPADLEINTLIDQLASPTLAERDDATERLEQYEGPLESLIRPHLGAADLSPEQAVRLETILKFRFMQSPRAALGVGFAPAPQANNRAQQIPVVLDRVLAGFPCSKTLKPGDIIRVVDGYELPATGGGNHVRTAIISHLPGEEIELTIERDGRRSFIRVPLGDYARLNNAGPARMTPPTAMLKAAWNLRKARLGFGALDSSSPLPLVIDGARSELPNLPVRKEPTIWSGGSPDNGAALLHLLRARASTLQGRNNVAAIASRRVNVAQPAKRIVVQVQPANSPRARINQLQTQLKRAMNDRNRFIQVVGRDDISPEQQRAAIAELTTIEAKIATIKSDISKLGKNEAKKKGVKSKPQD